MTVNKFFYNIQILNTINSILQKLNDKMEKQICTFILKFISKITSVKYKQYTIILILNFVEKETFITDIRRIFL